MTITATPQYPTATQELTLSLTGAVGTKFAFELTAAPSQSTLTKGLLLKKQPVGQTVPVSPLLAASENLLESTFTPDAPGQYSFTAYDIREVVGTPAFVGDPSGETRFELLGTQSGVVEVGAVMELPVATTDGNGGTIQLTVVGDYIRAAAIGNPTSEVGRVASLQTDVVKALSDIVGKKAKDAGTDFLAALKELRDKYNGNTLESITGHRERALTGTSTAVHFAADNVNTIDEGIPFSEKFSVKLINDIRSKLLGHLEDSASFAVSQGTVTVGGVSYKQWNNFWHFGADQQGVSVSPVYTSGTPAGVPGADGTTTPVVNPAVDLPTATVLLCELRWRVYDRHIRLGHGGSSNHPWLDPDKSSAPHIDFDRFASTDGISDVPMSSVDEIIVKYLDAIVRMDSSFEPPAAEGTGISNMAHKYGFVTQG